MTTAETQPWHSAFPAPTVTAPIMPRRRAMQMLSLKGVASLLIIDVRRTDFEGGMISGGLNIPAQGKFSSIVACDGFWLNRGMLYELAYKADIQWVVFTCGSSNGRGPRCAAWFLQYVREQAGDENMQIMTLEGGVKGWVKEGPQYTRLMDGYDAKYWEDLFAEEAARAAANAPTTTEQGTAAA